MAASEAEPVPGEPLSLLSPAIQPVPALDPGQTVPLVWPVEAAPESTAGLTSWAQLLVRRDGDIVATENASVVAFDADFWGDVTTLRAPSGATSVVRARSKPVAPSQHVAASVISRARAIRNSKPLLAMYHED